MLSVVFATALTAAAAPGFDTLEADATRVRSLGRFLEETVGTCGALKAPQRTECRTAAAEARRAQEGELFVLKLDRLKGKLTKPKWDPERRAYRVLWTPIAGAGGLGLSVGRPRRLDGRGNPVIERRPLWVKRPRGTPEFIFLRNLERGMVHLDVLFVIGAPWRLERRSGPPVEGLSVKLRGWRLATRGSVLAERVMSR